MIGVVGAVSAVVVIVGVVPDPAGVPNVGVSPITGLVSSPTISVSVVPAAVPEAGMSIPKSSTTSGPVPAIIFAPSAAA